MKLFVVFIALGFFSIEPCRCIKVAMISMFGRSHFIVLEKLAVELQNRGHKVVIVVGEESTYAAKNPFVKLFKHSEEMAEVMKGRGTNRKHLTAKSKNVFETVSRLFTMQTSYCDSLLRDSSALNEIKTADILIGDALYPCSVLVADWLDLPNVSVMMSGMQSPLNTIFGLPSNPLAYVPQTMSGLSAKNMGLLARIKNLGFYLVNEYVLVEYFLFPTYEKLKDKYGIQPTKTIKESIASVDLLISAADFALQHAQPMMPYVREVGFFMPSPAQPLPAELEAFMQESGDDGVILVSFGTAIDVLDQDVFGLMSKAFAQMPHKILWKVYSGSRPKSVSPNVKLVEWLPQNDILGHNKTRLFITHAGANGMAETAYHGVPVVCSPFFGDQPDNAQTMKDAGIGEILSVNYATAEQLVSVINKVLNEESYKKNAARISRAMKKRVRTPVEEAADLVEYVQALGGHMDHLKPRSLYMPFYQVYMLDVMAVLALALVVIIVVIVGLVRLVAKACLSKKAKTS